MNFQKFYTVDEMIEKYTFLNNSFDYRYTKESCAVNLKSIFLMKILFFSSEKIVNNIFNLYPSEKKINNKKDFYIFFFKLS